MLDHVSTKGIQLVVFLRISISLLTRNIMWFIVSVWFYDWLTVGSLSHTLFLIQYCLGICHYLLVQCDFDRSLNCHNRGVAVHRLEREHFAQYPLSWKMYFLQLPFGLKEITNLLFFTIRFRAGSARGTVQHAAIQQTRRQE